jgi:pimeloyl-ACP methyl ester carboxylesterase
MTAGHGRSAKTYSANDMETYARDLAEQINSLDLRHVILAGHSTGGGEVVRYAAGHGHGRVAKIITAGAVPPSWSTPTATPRVRRSSCSTGSAEACSRTGRSSSRTCPDRSSVPIATVRMCRRARGTTSGGRACWSTWSFYPGSPHGIHGAYQEALDRDILEFIAS